MCFDVAASGGAGSWPRACPRQSQMPSETTDVSEGGLWRTFRFISINKVALLNECPLSVLPPAPTPHFACVSLTVSSPLPSHFLHIPPQPVQMMLFQFGLVFCSPLHSVARYIKMTGPLGLLQRIGS